KKHSHKTLMPHSKNLFPSRSSSKPALQSNLPHLLLRKAKKSSTPSKQAITSGKSLESITSALKNSCALTAWTLKNSVQANNSKSQKKPVKILKELRPLHLYARDGTLKSASSPNTHPSKIHISQSTPKHNLNTSDRTCSTLPKKG